MNNKKKILHADILDEEIDTEEEKVNIEVVESHKPLDIGEYYYSTLVNALQGAALWKKQIVNAKIVIDRVNRKLSRAEPRIPLEDQLRLVRTSGEILSAIAKQADVFNTSSVLTRDNFDYIKETRSSVFTRAPERKQSNVDLALEFVAELCAVQDNGLPYFTTLDKQAFLDIIDDPEKKEVLANTMKRNFFLYYFVMFNLNNNQSPSLPSFYPDAFKHFQRLAEGKVCKHLMLLYPPAYGKTSLVQMFVAWCFSRNIDYKFLYVSHSSTLAQDRSSEIRDILDCCYSRQLFSIQIDSAKGSTKYWRLQGAMDRSGVEASSLEASLTGKDAGNPNMLNEDFTTVRFTGGVILDDPMDAGGVNSLSVKEKVVSNYLRKVKTRLRNHAFSQALCILPMQRLCQDDLVGWIMENESPDWVSHTVPALDRNDVSTWEDRLPTKKLLAMRDMVSMKGIFNAQYQQSPILETAGLFNADWFKLHDDNFYDSTSSTFKIFMTVDTATKTSNASDYSVFCLWYLMDNGLFLVDMIRGKWEMPELVKQAVTFYRKHLLVDPLMQSRNPLTPHDYKLHSRRGAKLGTMYIEDANAGTSLLQTLRTADQTIRIPVLPLRAEKDKVTRASQWTPYIESGWLHLPKHNLQLTNTIIAECVAFTKDDTHLHDDIVDCLLYACEIAFAHNRLKYKLRFEL